MGGEVFISTDHGDNWTQAHNSLPGTPYALIVDSTAPTTLYAGIWLGAVYKSENAGYSWQPVGHGFPAINTALSLAIDPSDPNTLFAGTNGASGFTIEQVEYHIFAPFVTR